jgi:hypothetical protein
MFRSFPHKCQPIRTFIKELLKTELGAVLQRRRSGPGTDAIRLGNGGVGSFYSRKFHLYVEAQVPGEKVALKSMISESHSRLIRNMPPASDIFSCLLILRVGHAPCNNERT